MNRADLVYAICHLLGLRPKPTSFPLPVGERELTADSRRA
jgi:hypothetical protein